MAHQGRRHEEHEEHENHERWLVTYADMVTLLMVLFIVMFAMSAVDQKKFNELKVGLAAGFGSTDSILLDGTAIQEADGQSPVDAVQPQMQISEMSEKDRKTVTEALATNQRLQEERERADVAVEAQRLDDVRKKLMAALREKGLEDDVKATYDERGLVVSLVSRHIVFRNDRAELTPRGVRVVDALGPTLAELDDRLEIDGHTNQVKVEPKYYDTDWDLSAARALTVLRRLNESFAIPAERLTLAAFGHTKPLLAPSKPASQEINKRVDIVVLTALPPDSAALLADSENRDLDKPAPGREGGSGRGEVRLASQSTGGQERNGAEHEAGHESGDGHAAEHDSGHDTTAGGPVRGIAPHPPATGTATDEGAPR